MKPSIVFIALFLPLSFAAEARASCAQADLCSPAECIHRQSHVHPTCDQPRSCQNVLPSDVPRIQLYEQRNLACALARTYVSECFSTVDAGHQQAINAANRAAQTCAALLN